MSADIHLMAAARAEATVYSLQNTYLAARQKAELEAVYQFPLGVFFYAFVAFTLVVGTGPLSAYILASIISLPAWLFARFVAPRWLYYFAFLYAGWTSTVVALGVAVWAGFQQDWITLAFALASIFALDTFIELPMWLWIAASRKMNAKYVLAKKMFGVAFPFEALL
jgi:hypothetical protein